MKRLFIFAVMTLHPGFVYAQDVRPALALMVRCGEYYGLTYANGPVDGADYVFFTGERIRVSVAIGNRGLIDDELALRRAGLDDVLSIQATRNGNAISFPLRLLRSVIGAEEKILVSDISRVPLKTGEEVQWHFEAEGALSPGIYVITFATDATDAQLRNVLEVVPSLRFEVRRETRADSIELMRRRATKSLAENDLASASSHAAELLRAHPQSFEGNVILASVAERRRSGDVAKQYFERALALLERNEDALALKYRGAEQLRQTKAQLAGRAGRPPQ